MKSQLTSLDFHQMVLSLKQIKSNNFDCLWMCRVKDYKGKGSQRSLHKMERWKATGEQR